MPDFETYEDLKNNENIKRDENLRILTKEIDEIKDTSNKDDDKIEGVFVESDGGPKVEKVLNGGLQESLNKQSSETIQILINEINRIYKDTNLQLDNDVKNSLKELQNLLNGILNRNLINELKDSDLTKKQIKNIQLLQELGFNIQTNDIETIKDLDLTKRQIKNIKILHELGIELRISDIDSIKNLDKSDIQVTNIQKLLENGVDVKAYDIELIKYIDLTDTILSKAKKIHDLGIYINVQDILWLKDLSDTRLANAQKLNELGVEIDRYDQGIGDLTDKQLANVKKLHELGYNITKYNIKGIKDLTEEQLTNIQRIKELGININELYMIEKYKDEDITDIQFEIIKGLHEHGDIDEKDILLIKDLTEEQLTNIQRIKELGIDFYNSGEMEEFKDLNLTEEQFTNIKKIKELGIDFYTSGAIEEIKDLNLTEEQLTNIKKLKEVGIDLDIRYIEEIKDLELTDEQLTNIQRIKELGIYLDLGYIEQIKDLTNTQIKNIEKLHELGYELSINNINDFKNLQLTESQLNNIQKVQNLGFNVKLYDLYEIKDMLLTENQISNIQKIQNLGIKIYIENIKEIGNLTPKQINNIIKAQEYGIDITIEDIRKIKDLQLTDKVLKDIKAKDDNHRIESKSNYKFDTDEQDILNIDSNSFYEGYNYTKDEIEAHHRYKRGRIIEDIQSYVENFISENRDIGKAEILNKVRSDLITLPINEKKNLIIGINKVVKKFNTIRKYLDFKKGPYRTPKQLLCAIRGITNPNIIKKINKDITVKQHGLGLTFFVGNERSYQIIYDIDLKDSGERSGGFNCSYSGIPGLEGTLSVVNGIDPDNKDEYSYGTIRHEGQHNRNTYFMLDRNQGPITDAKDEITAFLRDGRGIFEVDKRDDTIEDILTKPAGEGGLYQYGLKGKKREEHKNQVRRLLYYANDLIELTKDSSTGITRDKVISMLSDTPRERWKELHSSIMSAVNSNESLTDKFRRAGTAEKQTEINEINIANSIEEIKHILNDPKYSHISRVPNNKGGIEISAIIDEVVAGNLDITYIPIEIRQKVQEFISK